MALEGPASLSETTASRCGVLVYSSHAPKGHVAHPPQRSTALLSACRAVPLCGQRTLLSSHRSRYAVPTLGAQPSVPVDGVTHPVMPLTPLSVAATRRWNRSSRSQHPWLLSCSGRPCTCVTAKPVRGAARIGLTPMEGMFGWEVVLRDNVKTASKVRRETGVCTSRPVNGPAKHPFQWIQPLTSPSRRQLAFHRRPTSFFSWVRSFLLTGAVWKRLVPSCQRERDAMVARERQALWSFGHHNRRPCRGGLRRRGSWGWPVADALRYGHRGSQGCIRTDRRV